MSVKLNEIQSITNEKAKLAIGFDKLINNTGNQLETLKELLPEYEIRSQGIREGMCGSGFAKEVSLTYRLEQGKPVTFGIRTFFGIETTSIMLYRNTDTYINAILEPFEANKQVLTLLNTIIKETNNIIGDENPKPKPK